MTTIMANEVTPEREAAAEAKRTCDQQLEATASLTATQT